MISLIAKGQKKEDFVIVTDIGCNSKIYDYLNVSGLYGLHGRALPAALGVNNGNPKLNVIAIAGDGGAYMEGISHFVHACRYNQNITYLVFNNQVFSLTTGQASTTTEKGFVARAHPVKEEPMNPLVLALDLGASFVARSSAMDLQHLTDTIQKAIEHKGFSFVDIIQPCGIYHDIRSYAKTNTYKIEPLDRQSALIEAKKWNHMPEDKFPIGIFCREEKETFEEKYL
jgi:2-oxoglutarate ferredoxin oxidoreductase subunit beta